MANTVTKSFEADRLHHPIIVAVSNVPIIPLLKKQKFSATRRTKPPGPASLGTPDFEVNRSPCVTVVWEDFSAN